MSYSPALKLMEQLSSAEDEDVAKAARNSLSYFPNSEGNASLKAMLENERPEARRVAVELIGKGGLDKPAALLFTSGYVANERQNLPW